MLNLNKSLEEIELFFSKKDYKNLIGKIISFYGSLNEFVYLNKNNNTKIEIDKILDLTFKILQDENFVFSNSTEKMLSYTNLISNLCYLSDRTTLEIRQKLLSRENIQLDKILFLTSPHQEINISEIEIFFKLNKELISYWIYAVFYRYDYAEKKAWNNLKQLGLFAIKYELNINFIMTTLYFGSTYVLPELHLEIRKKLNNIIYKNLKYTPIKNNASKKKNRIAIATKFFGSNHAAFKCVGSFIKKITQTYDVDLLLFKKNPDEIDPLEYPIKNIYNIKFLSNFIDYKSIQKNNYNAVIFLDIGMTIESIFLSNIRIAPVQLSMYGHPVSSQSKFIDYFIVGKETEINTDYYSEKTISIDGSGMNPTVPPTKRRKYIKNKQNEIIEIAILSSSSKINPESIALWKQIVDNTTKPIKFHIFIGNGSMQSSAVVKQELTNNLKNIEVHIFESYDDYMNILENCHLTLGSYHYGDFNVIIDSLWANTPPLVIQGEQAYQNTGVGALKSIHLKELIAKDKEEYVKKAIKLIERTAYRELITKKISKIKLIGNLIENEEYNNILIKKLDHILNK